MLEELLAEERRNRSCEPQKSGKEEVEQFLAELAGQVELHEKRMREVGMNWSLRTERNIWSKQSRLLWCQGVRRSKAPRYLLRKRTPLSFVESEFARLCEEWKHDTMHSSSMTRMLSHRSYLGIIGLAARADRHEVERLLLEELQKEPDHWFEALSAITGEDPVKPEDDFDQAVDAWLEWGRQRRII